MIKATAQTRFCNTVIPAKAGIYRVVPGLRFRKLSMRTYRMDSGFRRNDGGGLILTNFKILANLPLIDSIGKFGAREKNPQNELIDRDIRENADTRPKHTPRPSLPLTRNEPIFYAMKKGAIRLRIVHRFTHRFSSCPPAAL